MPVLSGSIVALLSKLYVFIMFCIVLLLNTMTKKINLNSRRDFFSFFDISWGYIKFHNEIIVAILIIPYYY